MAFFRDPNATSRAIALLLLMIAGPLGCKACDEDEVVSQRSAQDETAVRRSRLAQRALPRDRNYPKAEDGSVSCGKDIDCFLIQTEQCTPATLNHTEVHEYLGLSQISEANYRIESRAGDKCVVTRQMVRLQALLDDSMAQALRKAGKTEDDLEDMRDGTLYRLREYYSPKIECTLTPGRLTDRLLDLADGKYAPLAWRSGCTQVAGAKIPYASDGVAAVDAAAPTPKLPSDAPAEKQPQ